MLEVLMDVTALAGTRTGVGHFTDAVCRHLARDPRVALTTIAFTWHGRSQIEEALPEGVRHCRVPVPARPARIVWTRSKRPPVDWVAGRHDVFYGPNYFAPPTRGASVVSVHDLTFWLYPDLAHPATLEFARLVALAAERGSWFHTAANAVAEQIEQAFPAAAGRVVVVPDGVTPVPEADPAEGRRLAGADRYILSVGTIEPRKNFPTLVRAFDLLANRLPDVGLVIAGPPGWDGGELERTVASADAGDRIRLLGWVTDRQRAALFRGASVFAFPSLYEGFGLPPLEAMTAGVPVVASDAGSLPEVLGDAAILVPPKDVGLLAESLLGVLSDDELAATLVAKGSQRVASYTWERCVDGLVQLFERARAT
ncbi:MAG: glycosyl transferase [Acidimicrobiales bacterium]|nr:MAG: glycosyl transferase [Acidimicrobiales bacterium]